MTKDNEEKKVDIKEKEFEKKKYSPLSHFTKSKSWFPPSFWDIDQYPFSHLRRLFNDNTIFETLLLNINEEEDHFNITAEIPGLEKGDIEISVQDDNLEIKGEQKSEIEDKKEGYIRKEYSSSSYYRKIRMPKNIDKDKIEAKLNKGILKIILPKLEKEKKEKKKIQIE